MSDIIPSGVPPKPAWRARVAARLPRRRTALIVWFVIVTPEVALAMGGRTAFLIHSNLALIFVTVSLLWTADYLRRGLASRPGPKLPFWARQVHRWIHLSLVWGLFLVALTGFLLGLTSTVQLRAGGFLPFAPPLGMPPANKVVGAVHIYQFYLLALIVVGHAGFHIWRHFRLRDNALRSMLPKALHRFV